MSKLKTCYVVMCYPKHSDMEVEYTGTIYEDQDEAKIEWFRAKEDPAVASSWVETLLCPDVEDDWDD